MELEVAFNATVYVRINTDLTVEEYRELMKKSPREQREYFSELGYFDDEFTGQVDQIFPLQVDSFETTDHIRDEDDDYDIGI